VTEDINMEEKELLKKVIFSSKAQAFKMAVVERFLNEYGSLNRETLKVIIESCRDFYLSKESDVPEDERKAVLKILEDEISKWEI
jgi:hypothetical protein